MASLKKTIALEIERDVDYGMGAAPEPMTIRVVEMSHDMLDSLVDGDKSKSRIQAEAIARMVSKWDLRGPVPLVDTGELKEGALVAEDELIPLDPDVIEKLPAPVIEGLAGGIWAAATPKRRSPDGTSTETPSE